MSDEVEENARRLAEQHGLRFVDLTRSTLAPGAATLLPEAVARRHHVVPIGRRLGTPVIAVSDPGDLFAMDALRASVGREFVAVVASDQQVTDALRQLYAPGTEEEEANAPIQVDSETTGAETQPAPVMSSVAVADPPAPPTDVEDTLAEPDSLSSEQEDSWPVLPGQSDLRDLKTEPFEAGRESTGSAEAADLSESPATNGNGNGHANGNGNGHGTVSFADRDAELGSEKAQESEDEHAGTGKSLGDSLREVLVPQESDAALEIEAEAATDLPHEDDGSISAETEFADEPQVLETDALDLERRVNARRRWFRDDRRRPRDR